MRTISGSEFLAHPEKYLNMAVEQDVRIQKGREMFHIVYAPPVDEQPILQPDDDLRRALSANEFREKLKVVLEGVDRKFAQK
jgi:hypothetical protein